MRFKQNNNHSGYVALDNSDDTVELSCVSLDSTLLGSDVNFIKMDIEGSEIEALQGAKYLIKKNKPVLAICLYHKPDDLWEIPILINRIYNGYDMYLRVHGDMCLETVLYCIPNNKSN